MNIKKRKAVIASLRHELKKTDEWEPPEWMIFWEAHRILFTAIISFVVSVAVNLIILANI